MAIIQLEYDQPRSQRVRKPGVDLVAVHDIFEDEVQTWTDSSTKFLWLRDLLPQMLGECRILTYGYKSETLLSPGIDSTKSILNHAHNLVAELCADRQLSNGSERPIIFICHGFGGLLVKRALAYSHSRVDRAVQHLRSIYTCTYGILFFGTPHGGVKMNTIVARNPPDKEPTQFMISLSKGSEMLDDLNDQFAPLMKQFSVFNFWETIKTSHGSETFYIVEQESAAPAWDNVEKCGISATHSTMTKCQGRSDRRFQPVLEALLRYKRLAPSLIKTRLQQDKELIQRIRQQEADEILRTNQSLLESEAETPNFNQWCLIPRKSSTYFTGRQKHARDVSKMLGPIRRYESRCKSKVLVIHGLGGSGKTQFCLKYAEDNKHSYWGVFWLDASSEKSVEAGYALIGTQFGRGATMTSAIHWLSQRKESWLLILDNADDPDLDISSFYPSEGNGRVIITTRNPNVIEHSTVGHFRFRGMEPHEAISLLLRAAYPDGSHSRQPKSSSNWQLAEGIAVELGYLPLAIAHAGATIRSNIYTLERYLKYYLPERRAMLSHSKIESVDEVNIITTWEIPFQKILSRQSTEYRDAVDLMYFLAFMHHENIPEQIFQRSWGAFEDPRAHLQNYPEILQPVWNEGAQARLRRAIRVLCDHSIIEYEPTKASCNMHPVIHNWARARLREDDQILWLRCTMSILGRCISTELEASGRQFRAVLLPHISSCIKLQGSKPLHELNSLLVMADMERFAWVYAEQGQWTTALKLQRKVLEVRIKHLGKRHRDTVNIQRSLGRTLWNLFKMEEAIKIQRNVLDILRWQRPSIAEWAVWPIWLPVHIPYCLALSDITLTLWLAGERHFSEMTGRRAVDGLTKRLGPADPQTLMAMFNLARTYFHVGKQTESRDLLVWVLRLQKRFFGMNHPDTLMTRNELGMLLCASKRHLIAAKRLVENVLIARKRILGEEHAYTLWSVNDLSKLYVELGRPNEAVAMLEEITPIVERTLGKDHVGMSMTRSNLGRAYFQSERFEEAEQTVRPLLATIPPNHPDAIHTMYGYAHILFKMGDVENAEKHCANIMDMVTKKKLLSLSDPRTVSTAELLIDIYHQQGGREEQISSLQTLVPGVGLTKNEDKFDPYAVRRSSGHPPLSRDREISTPQGKEEEILENRKEMAVLRPNLQEPDVYARLVSRHTF